MHHESFSQAEPVVNYSQLRSPQANDRKQLKDIEEKILRMLSESSGMILDDIDLINTLGDAKFTSNVINERVKEAQQTQEDITTIREKYRPVATRGSILYFAICDLSLIDPMYQHSLAYFTRLFGMCIEQAAASTDLNVRLDNLLQYMTRAVFKNVCRGVFEAHKLIFSLLICSQILREKGTVSRLAWNFLIRGAAAVGAAVDSNAAPNPVPEVIPDDAWHLISLLEANIPAFQGRARALNLSITRFALYSSNHGYDVSLSQALALTSGPIARLGRPR